MADFTGLFFDGKSVEGYPAKVNLAPTALQIAYQTPAQAVPVTIYWQVHRLEKKSTVAAGKTILYYGNFPGQTLEINEPDFLTAFEKYYSPAPAAPQPAQTGFRQKKRGLGAIYLFFISLLALIPITYFILLPAAADMISRRIPFAYEQKLGRTLAAKLIPQSKINQSGTANLRGFMRQLKLSKATGVSIYLVQDTVPNAFALPGGTIVVHQAMLPLIKNPDELAALLGHEYGHIALRHSLRTLFRNLSGYFLISMVLGDVGAISAIILHNAQAFKSLAYSRAFENEADKMGFAILLQNNLNPAGMVQLFKHLQELHNSQEKEYLSSHPLLSTRMANIQKLIAQNPHQILPHDSLIYYFRQLKQTIKK